MVYEIFVITQDIFSLIYAFALQLKSFYYQNMNDFLSSLIGDEISIFPSDATVLSTLFGAALIVSLSLLLWNVIKNFISPI